VSVQPAWAGSFPFTIGAEAVNQPDIVFAATLDRAYRRTREQFERWAFNPEYYKYVVPPATKPRAGFAICYTPPIFQPKLLIVGQNPSNFAGAGSLEASPNDQMLSGQPPSVSSYDAHEHLFGRALRDAFSQHPQLYEGCVGMNVWHFQCTSSASSAPKPLKDFFEETSREVVDAMQPCNVLCFGRPAFSTLAGTDRRVKGAAKAETVTRGGTVYWYVPHLTGSWSRADAERDLPIVLDEMQGL
jgi:hypothetical protein